jgi:hypothetical protein
MQNLSDNTLLLENQRSVPEEETTDGGYYGESKAEMILPASDTDAVLDVNIVNEYFEGGDKLYHTYGHTVYNSKYEKAIMKGLSMSRVGSVVPIVKEIEGDSAIIELSARMVNRVGEDVKYFTEREFYTLNYNAGKDSFVLVNYERLIDESFSRDDVISNTGRIKLGLVSEETPEFAQSADSSKVAFVMDNTLWYYSSGDDYYTKNLWAERSSLT